MTTRRLCAESQLVVDTRNATRGIDSSKDRAVLDILGPLFSV